MKKAIKKIAGFDKPLKELAYFQLMECLVNNENTDHRVLACVCSEILRRLLVLHAEK
jgi:hypothetical protein